MSHRVLSVGIALLCLLLQSCSDGATAPATREISLKACPNYATWAAYQNDGSSMWTRIDGLAEGVTLRVTNRLKIATYYPGADRLGLTIDFLTADQAEATYNCPSGLGPAIKTVSGSVLGLASDEFGYVTMTPFSIAILTRDGAFTTRIVDGPVDLVASRIRFSPTDGQTTAMIIRRAQNPGDGATLPALDFNSAEAFALASSAVTFAGVPSGWRASAGVEFTARGGTPQEISGATATGQQATIQSVPSSRVVTGDYHSLTAQAQGSPGLLGFNEFYRDQPPATIAFGPQLPEPVFTTVATTPTLRVRVDVPAQPEYGEGITIMLGQGNPTRAVIIMHASKEYFGGTPSTWSLTVPDLSGADGYSASWGLSSGGFWWNLQATSYPFGFSAGRDAKVGDVYRSVTRAGSQ